MIFAVAALAAAVLAISANAAPVFTLSTTVGSKGSGSGQFNNPEGVAIDSTGNVFVTDELNSRVQEFNAKGEFIRQFSGEAGHELYHPKGIAIDSKGNIWVVSNDNYHIMKFNSEGKYLSQFGELGEGAGQFRDPSGIAIDSKDNLWVVDFFYERVQEYSSEGKYLGQFKFSFYTPSPAIAIDSKDNIWLSDYPKGRVDEYNTAGTYLGQIGEGQLNQPAGNPAFDAEGNLWVADTNDGVIKEFNTKGEYLNQFGNPELFYQYTGLAIGDDGFWVVHSGANHIEKWAGTTTTRGQLSSMAITEPFNGNTANYVANWSKFGWATEKGSDSVTGWRPQGAFPIVNGAFFSPTVTDSGSGVAAVATMAVNPANSERYFSLWLDASGSAGTREGYELKFYDASTNTYNVTLSKWKGGTQTVLASKSSYSFVNGNSLALVDIGGTVSAWTKTGAEFSELLSASDATFAGGNAGVEGAGNITKLTNFKAGTLLAPAVDVDGALKNLTLNDSFARNEIPLSLGGAWSKLKWALYPGRVNSGGWGPNNAYPNIDGAYWTKASFADTGAGVGTTATLVTAPGTTSAYFSLWLDMPTPTGTQAGYELRFTETSTGVYEVSLSKWVAAVRTVLTSKSSYSLPIGSQFAVVDKGETVSVWTKTGSTYAQLLSASDSAFNSGYTGLSGAGNATRLKDFRSGPVAPF